MRNCWVRDVVNGYHTATFPVGLFDLDCTNHSKINMSELPALLVTAGFLYANDTNWLVNKSSALFLDIDSRVRRGNEVTQSIPFGSLIDSQIVIWSCKVRLSTRNVTIGCFDGREYAEEDGILQAHNIYSGCQVLSVGVATILKILH